MIHSAGDSIWAPPPPSHGSRGDQCTNGRGADPTARRYEEEMARRRRFEQVRRENEDLDKEWAAPHPDPDPATDIAQILDREYARHQRKNRGWGGMIFAPDPIDNSLPREEWDERVRGYLRNPTRVPGAIVARDPHALVGEDTYKGVRRALVDSLGVDGITNKGVADKLRDHYGMGRPGHGRRSG